jgi:L-amino acid N-acyltransferase YncA
MSDYATAHKVPEYDIVPMTHDDPGFYDAVGPWLASRDVAAETGSVLWDDPGKVWSVARSHDGRTLGVAALHRDAVCSLYVEPSSRGQMVGFALLRSLVAHATGPLRATATEDSRDLFTALGFTETGTRGRYSLMRREAPDVLPE